MKKPTVAPKAPVPKAPASQKSASPKPVPAPPKAPVAAPNKPVTVEEDSSSSSSSDEVPATAAKKAPTPAAKKAPTPAAKAPISDAKGKAAIPSIAPIAPVKTTPPAPKKAVVVSSDDDSSSSSSDDVAATDPVKKVLTASGKPSLTDLKNMRAKVNNAHSVVKEAGAMIKSASAGSTPKKSGFSSCSDCEDFLKDTDRLLKEARAQLPCPNLAAPVCKKQKDCCKECMQHENLSKALDTSCLDKHVEAVKKAAKEPLEDPRLQNIPCEKKPNQCLSDLVDTNSLVKKVECVEQAVGTIPAEEPCECKVNWDN